MKAITSGECIDWLAKHDAKGSFAAGPELIGDYEVMFAAPKEGRLQAILARQLVSWVGEFETALFWLSDWPFYQPDEMAIIMSMRRGHGECREVIDAPGHVFNITERDEMVGWISLMINFGWDGHLYTSPFHGNMFQTSHEDFIWATSSDRQRYNEISILVREWPLEIYRETKPA
jgi:hypothetical protein